MKRVTIFYKGGKGEVSWNKKRLAKFRVKGNPRLIEEVRRLLTTPRDFVDGEYLFKALPTSNNSLFESVLSDIIWTEISNEESKNS